MISVLFSIRQRLRIIISLIYLSCTAILSLVPPKSLPQIQLFPGADKIVHAGLYLGLAFLACWSMPAGVKRSWYYYVIIFSVVWGILMEIFQFIMHQGRSFEFNDVISNITGTLIGVYFYILLSGFKTKI